MNLYDDTTHTYSIEGRTVPSVTQVLKDVIGMPFQASDFHLERGRAVHACAAMIARGEAFDHDPRIAGQVDACRRFLAFMSAPLIEVETPHYNKPHGFAGTADLIVLMDGRPTVIDYKASATPLLKYQLAAYGMLTGAKRGFGVILHEDGTFKVTPAYKLDTGLKAQFLALLATWKIKREI